MASFLLILGILLTRLALIIRSAQKTIDSWGGRTPGRVIGYVSGKSIGQGPGFYAVFKSTWKGEERYIRSALPSLHPEFAHSQEVELKFNEETPPRAYAPTNFFQHLSLGGLILGGTLIALGAWMFRWESASLALAPLLVLATVGSLGASKRKDNSKTPEAKGGVQTHLFRPCLSHEEVAACQFLPLSIVQEKRRQYEQWVRTFSLITLIIGLGWVILAGREIENRYRFVTSAQRAVGQVVPLEHFRYSFIAGTPPVRFRMPASEKEVQVLLPVGSYPLYYRLGDKVEVLYDPKQPENAMIDWGAGNFINLSILLLAGLIFFAWSLKRYLKLNP